MTNPDRDMHTEKLTREELSAMRSVVHAYVAMKPVRAPTSAAGGRVSSRWSSTNIFFSARSVAAVLVGALFLGSAGVSAAAQRALPGDVLYPIKTNVNEKIAVALAVSPAAKAAVATQLAGERVKEAAALAAEGRLDAPMQAALQQNFDENAALAIASMAQQASTSPADGTEAALRFAAQLSEYERVLAEIGSARNIGVGELARAVSEEHARAAALADATISSTATSLFDAAAASQVRAAALSQLDASLELARSAEPALSSSSVISVIAELQGASSTIAEGDNLLDTNSVPQALGAFQRALSATERLGVYLQTTAAIHDRTGIVIGQPTGDHKQRGERVAAEATASETGAASTSVAPTFAPAPTTLGATASTETSTNPEANTHAEDAGGDIHAEGHGSLQIAVPTIQ